MFFLISNIRVSWKLLDVDKQTTFCVSGLITNTLSIIPQTCHFSPCVTICLIFLNIEKITACFYGGMQTKHVWIKCISYKNVLFQIAHTYLHQNLYAKDIMHWTFLICMTKKQEYLCINTIIICFCIHSIDFSLSTSQTTATILEIGWLPILYVSNDNCSKH